MTSMVDIMKAIQDIAAEKVPELKRVYIGLKPKKMQRPCLFVEPVTDSRADGNAILLDENTFFTITAFVPTDNYDRSDTIGLLELQGKTLDLFRKGFIKVGNRSLHVQASTGGHELDKAYVDVQMAFFDLRDETEDARPLMEEIETKIIEKG